MVKQLQPYKTRRHAVNRAKKMANRLKRDTFVVWWTDGRDGWNYMPLGVELSDMPYWVPEPQSKAAVVNRVTPEGTVWPMFEPLKAIEIQNRIDALPAEERERLYRIAAIMETTATYILDNGQWVDGKYAPKLELVRSLE